MDNKLLIDYIDIVKNYLSYSYSDRMKIDERNALTFFYIAKYSKIKGRKLTDEETIKCITKGENDKGICGIYINDNNEQVLEVNLIKTRYINAFNKCSLTDKDLEETIIEFSEFPNIKDCNEKINYWQEKVKNYKSDSTREIKINFILLTNGHVSPHSKSQAVNKSIKVFEKEGAIFTTEALKAANIYKFEKLQYDELQVKEKFNNDGNINLRRIIMIYNLRQKLLTWLLNDTKLKDVTENLINKNNKIDVMNYLLYIFVKFIKNYNINTIDDRVELLKYNFDKFVNKVEKDDNVFDIKTLEKPFLDTMRVFLNDNAVLNSDKEIKLIWNEKYEQAFCEALKKVNR